MEFVLNSHLVQLENYPADKTLLRYLREDACLQGTKEGCASGDCGACTVILGELTDESIEYKTVNACITPLGAAHGKHLVTVEHLASKDALHPVQQAFVEHHASQCGFCTPGLVMSVTGFYCAQTENTSETSKEDICEAISGNLCRCTGYRPILDAGLDAEKAREIPLYNDSILATLRNIHSKKLQENTQEQYLRPSNLQEWQTQKLRHFNAPMTAGGTDLVLGITTRYQNMPVLMDISTIEELQIFEYSSDTVTLGAGLSYKQLEEKLADKFPAFVELLKRVGSTQIRNRGTLGGNIANGSPIADTPPIFLAFDAQLNLYGTGGNTRRIALKDFYLDYKKTQLKYNEIIVSISFPKTYLEDFHRFFKISKRYEDDISSVMGAFRISCNKEGIITDARIAFGGVAATPIRLSSAEALVIGKNKGDSDILHAVATNIKQTIRPLSDVRASADYRTAMAINLFKKAWHELNGEQIPSISAEVA